MFHIEKHKHYFTLYYNDNFVGNYETYREIREAKEEIMIEEGLHE